MSRPALLVLLLAALAPCAARAQGYEEARVRWGLERVGRLPEPAPEGKRVEAVLVAAEQVIAPDDPYPRLANALHARTREEVIRREVLLAPGEPFSAALADETARNLRRLGLFSVVRVLAVRGASPDAVAVLVVTQDVWSLRLSYDLSVAGGVVERARFAPNETNLFGRGQRLALDVTLKPDTVALGQSFLDRRLFGSRVQLSESAALLLGRLTGRLEGTRGALLLGEPLWALDVARGWEARARWSFGRTRVYRGGAPWPLVAPDGTAVDYTYDAREWEVGAALLRALGRRGWRLELAPGVGAYRLDYRVPAEASSSTEARAWLARTLAPQSDTAAYAALGAYLSETRFVVLRDVAAYGLSEDWALGPALRLEARAAPPLWPGASPFLEAGASARYRAHGAGGLLTLTLAGAARRVLGAEAGWTNRRWAAELHAVSPPLGHAGRLVARALVDAVVDDLALRVQTVGGGNGLRGAAADALVGRRRVLGTLEYRSPPLVVRTLHLGGLLFWDAASAWDRGGVPRPVHSVGAGVRFLFPQFNTQVFRLDFGWVLGAADRPPALSRFAFGGGQLTEVRPDLFDNPLR